MKSIKMVDLKGQYLRIKSEIDSVIQSVIESTAFINGPSVNDFAGALGDYMDIAHVVPCANGTDALQIALMGLGLEPGDEVILPVHTYVATAEVIALLRLEPVFVDVFPDTFTIDTDQIEEKITNKTKAIVPVHLYGQCADMERIMQMAEKYNLFVIEDTAQAIGAEYTFSDGTVKKAGTIGQVGTTSFFPSKNLGCFGDGGAMFVNDEKLAKRCRMIANHGQSKKYHHDMIGCNSRLDTLQAAILKVKLKYLDDYARRRNEVANYYDHALKDIEWITIPHRFPKSTHVFHQYTIKMDEGINRDKLQDYLKERGIPTMIYYPVPLHWQKAYRKEGFGEGSFPVTEKLSRTVLSLPVHTEMEEEQLEYICDTLRKFG